MPIEPDLLPQTRDRPDDAHATDRALAAAVVAGSEDAWKQFVSRYSRLILAVIHRYVPRHRIDDARSIYADVLEALYRGKLATYEGRSALSTWLVVVTRCAAIDELRRRTGGRELHDAIQALGPLERQVFQHYYVEGMSFGAVRDLVREGDARVSADRLLEMLGAIENRVNGRLSRRLAYDLRAQSVGGASGRLLEYLDHAQAEIHEREDGLEADFPTLRREARRTLTAIQDEVGRLTDAERRLLSLRFERGWTAKRIAEELGLEGPRVVYTWLDRVVRGLRRGVAARSRRTGVREGFGKTGDASREPERRPT